MWLLGGRLSSPCFPLRGRLWVHRPKPATLVLSPCLARLTILAFSYEGMRFSDVKTMLLLHEPQTSQEDRIKLGKTLEDGRRLCAYMNE